MKKIFTKITFVVMLFAIVSGVQAQVTDSYTQNDTLTVKKGWGWKTTTLASDQVLMINENFQNWPLNHDKANNSIATKARCTAAAYTSWDQEITLGDGSKANMSMFKCAAAPQGLSQNKIDFTPKNNPDDGKYGEGTIAFNNGAIADPEIGDPLSEGFLEVGRASSNGTSPASDGYVTLPAVKGAQIVQYTYSSIGGNKRGLTLKRSIDNGDTWTDVRNPTAAVIGVSLTQNGGGQSTAVLGSNGFISGYYCSGAGVYIEDVVGDGTETVILRFTINGTQDYRLHDLKVIAKAGGSSISKFKTSSTKVIGQKGQIEITDAEAVVTVYDVTGLKVCTILPGSQLISVPAGIYLVSEKGQPTEKVVVR